MPYGFASSVDFEQYRNWRLTRIVYQLVSVSTRLTSLIFFSSFPTDSPRLSVFNHHVDLLTPITRCTYQSPDCTF
ncbi:hypothetical protein H9L39_01025 [Fusarium oxysporum f. sp. albedinis]|nr:hypothetical protein H9L39_01025 [Fusarium oxysporum f. sp. albedinis]